MKKKTIRREGVPGVEAIVAVPQPPSESQSQHTPGPWRAAIGDDYRPRFGEVEHVCVEHFQFDAIDVYAPIESQTAEEHFANARLIAAAPDLLAAANWVASVVRHNSFCPALGTLGPDACNCGLKRNVLDAIAKAEGQ